MGGVTLRLDGARWREHLRTVVTSTPGIVPVIKGHGYGFGLGWLAGQAAELGVDTVAVGMAAEVGPVREHFDGDIVVLYPFDREAGDTPDDRVVTTVTRWEDLRELAAGPGEPRVLVEVATSMRRHGIAVEDLTRVGSWLDGVRFEGWTIHLPLRTEGRQTEALRLGRAALDVATAPLWLSHLPPDELTRLAADLGGAAGPVEVRGRVGTRLWLGDPGGRSTTATVLDVHPVRRGERAGYRGRVCRSDGHILVIAGGTSHGVGLEAPTPAASLRQRATAAATGSLAATGRALSPFTVAGRKRWFLEPPHMQSSLVFLPGGTQPPEVGEDVPVELRLTIATPDRIVVD